MFWLHSLAAVRYVEGAFYTRIQIYKMMTSNFIIILV